MNKLSSNIIKIIEKCSDFEELSESDIYIISGI